MSKETAAYALRLPKSLKKAVEQLSREEGTSINQFVASAVAEKVSALKTAEFFTQARNRADYRAFDRLMSRKTGAKPAPGDEIK
jgi:hypothetical protein